MNQQDAELVAHLAHHSGMKSVRVEEDAQGWVVKARGGKILFVFYSREEFESHSEESSRR